MRSREIGVLTPKNYRPIGQKEEELPIGQKEEELPIGQKEEGIMF